MAEKWTKINSFSLPKIDLGLSQAKGVIVDFLQVYLRVSVAVEFKAVEASSLQHHEDETCFIVVACLQGSKKILAKVSVHRLPLWFFRNGLILTDLTCLIGLLAFIKHVVIIFLEIIELLLHMSLLTFHFLLSIPPPFSVPDLWQVVFDHLS